MQQFFESKRQDQLGTAVLALLILLSVFFVFKTINEIREGSYLGRQYGYNSINIVGEGRAFAIPDTAMFSFSVRERASTVQASQDSVTKRMDAILAELKKAGVEEANIKTTNYSVYPRYEYQQGAAVRDGFPVPGREVLVGYEVYHTNEVKIKDTTKAGELLTTVGSLGATDVSGLSFTVEDEEAVKNEARAEAIEEAERNADILADQLDVKLVRLVSYYEEVPGGYYPMYDGAKGGTMMEMDAAQSNVAVAPDIAPGQNEIISRINLTYEIR